MDRNSEIVNAASQRRNLTPRYRFASAFRFAALVTLLGFSAGSAFSQTPDPDDPYPPPPKVISNDEKSKLEATNDVKRRTIIALELMEARMLKAEEFHDRQELEAMFLELGAFHGLIAHTFAFLEKSDKDSGRVLNNFKRLEIGLRKFTPRLEVIRRDLPVQYEFYPRVLVRYIREARTRAIEPLFGDSVVPGSKP